MRTAIVYYSQSGNTRYVAEKAAEALGADLIPLVPEEAYPDSGAKKFLWGGRSALMGEEPKLKPYSFDGSLYDRIIFGTPVWAGTFTPPLRSFIKEQKAGWKAAHFAVFVCCMGGGGQKTVEKLRKFLNIPRWDAELVLIDPMKKATEESEAKIREFCEALKQ